ncbi:MAG: AAA family ATPase [Polyangiaceae bacterium]|nr:AAA family ATPase [Polyangiaceae bacterium]
MKRLKTSPYRVMDTLREGPESTLVRAVRNADGRRLVCKVLSPNSSGAHDIERLKHEFDIAGSLDVPAVVKPLALESYQGLPVLVMPDIDARPLDHIPVPMETSGFLRLAVRLAAAIAQIHGQDVIHKDLKPSSILVDPTMNHVKIVDFGIASRLSREHVAPRRPRQIEGSLPYMSPEQTGRMSQPVDSRTDLYSLGVIFYELLTGKLPFEARDPLAWIHCHIAHAPPPLAEVKPGVPEGLSGVVMKLLEKMPDDRYQSAAGLLHDIEECIVRWAECGRIDAFSLGRYDLSDRLRIPQKLYGREEEIASLVSAFDRVVTTGRPEIVLVSGYSGIGKSSLIQELHKPVAQRRGFFVAGKFDQHRRESPYATIVQAFRELVFDLLMESEDRIAEWRKSLREALGVNGQLIVDVIAQVELIIGPQPPVPVLPPAEAQNRFRIVFREFIGVFTTREHPLALFFDDLQWADSGSLGLLEDLVTHTEAQFLLLVGAYRDHEVFPSHPLMLAIDNVRKMGTKTSNIVLGPLSPRHLTAFLADALRCSADRATPLSELLHEKTAGNPFFTIQFLLTLYEERLVEFNPNAGEWQWDIAKIRAKGLTDNVVALMIGKLSRLSPATLDAVKLAACLGNTADAAILAMVLGRSEQEVHAAFWDALHAGLLSRTGDTYKFTHDRVQEAAYSLIPEASRAAIHLNIGRILEAHVPPAKIAEQIFDIVNHLNRGVELITDEREREALWRLNFAAGRKAKSSIAHASALRYLSLASTLLAPDAWTTNYDDTFEIHLERSECEYLAGHFSQADALFNVLLENARSKFDCVRVYRLRMRLYQVSGRYDEGVTVALAALHLFGVTLPDEESEIRRATKDVIATIAKLMHGRRIADLIDAPMATDPEARAIIALLVESAPCAYIGRPRIFPLIALEAVCWSLERGNTEESCFAYSVYGLMLVSIFEDIPAGYEFSEMSLRLNEKLDDRKLRGTLLHLHGDHIHFWRKHFSTGFPILQQAFRACLDVGDLVYAGFLAFETVWQYIENGESLDDVLESSRKYAAFARQSHNDAVYETIRFEQQFVAAFQGMTQGLSSFEDGEFDEASSLQVITRATFGCGIVFHDIMKQIMAFHAGEHEAALELAMRAAANLGAAMAMPIEATYHFYLALTLAALHPKRTEEQQREILSKLDHLRQKHALWADNCPQNYQNRHALVCAEIARIQNRDMDAMRLYDQAIQSAHDNGFVHQEALAYEIAAKFYESRGFDLNAHAHAQEARIRYGRWGAAAKVKQMDVRYPRLWGQSRGATISSATFSARAEQLDLLSVVKASQTISGEIAVDKLLPTLLEVVLQQGGAQRACLVLVRDAQPSIEAEAFLQGQDVETKVLQSEPLWSSTRVPVSLARYAMRTKQRVILNDNAEMARYMGDPFIASVKPRSLSWLPIMRQGEVIGLLYLENDLVTGAFTTERIAALELLASQAAISLEHARSLATEQAERLRAEEALRARDEFLSIASHELNTPLASLLLSLQRLRRDIRGCPSGNPSMEKSVDRIERQCTRLSRLNADLLDVSRIHAQRLRLDRAEVDCVALVHDVVGQFQAEFERAGIFVSISAHRHLIGRWDRCRVEQIVANLISNAIKFGSGRPIEISVEGQSGMAQISVRDQGIGVAPEMRARIFERFERAVSDKHYGGLGLGLYIATEIAKAHGGTITVESEEGKGSTFTLSLPDVVEVDEESAPTV